MAVRPDAVPVPTGLGPLADARELHASIALTGDDGARLVGPLRMMMRIRAAEELIGEMVARGIVKCPCHLAIGQEAPAVGVASQLRATDRIFGAHRSHAHFLAIGGSLVGLMAEVQGRDTGVSRGMGGSMHLIDVAHGLYGTVPIVGATIPIAVGAGLAAKMDGNGDIAVSFFGDGATEEGVFHESANLAAVLQLPVLFVCENNMFSSHLHISLRQPSDSVARYAEAHCIPAVCVDGNDLPAVERAAAAAVTQMRDGGGPQFLELVTYRWRGHVGPREDEDVGVKRKEDLALWKGRDPIRRLADSLLAAGVVTERMLAETWDAVRSEVAEAWAQAARDPYPEPDALLARVYTRGAPERSRGRQ